MTRILYLPTGRYLKFLYKSPDHEVKLSDLSEILELSLTFNNKTLYNKSLEKFIDYLIKTEHQHQYNWASWFLEINNIIIPIIREDLEIVND